MAARPAPAGLSDAATRRTLDAERRVRGALRELERDGVSVSFVAVATRARVSRAFLYEHADLRAEVEALRAAETDAPARLTVSQRGSEASLRTRLRAALADNQELRQQIAGLREELARAHGRNRELERQQRTGR
jgi:uncharacterized protein DUF6262